MTANLSKNGRELLAAYEEVVNCRSDTNWALFTYEGNSDDIRLAEKGGGGLEEMVEELNSGKVMYAFCRVQDPNSGLPKYILINWTGEGVKSSRKGICANHVRTMANFLKGAHVTINARGEDDVEPETILEKVAKASGGNFSFHKHTQEFRDTPTGPVGSVYRKTNAMEEIQQTNKDEFWDREQRDEENRRREQAKRAEQERQALERERREMDEKQARERERKAKERAQQINQAKLYERKREEKERQRVREQQQHQQEQPLRSVYRKINAVEEIQQTNKDEFWDREQRDEENRRREQVKRAAQERQVLERERRDMDEKQARERERKAKERAQQIDQAKLYERKREEEREREQQQQQLFERTNESKRTGIKFAASVQKANEAKSLISQRQFNPRDIFKQREQSFEENNRPSPAASRPGKLQSPFLSQKSFERETEQQPRYPLAPATPLSPVSPVSPVWSYSPSAAVCPTPPETTGSSVPAADTVYAEEEEEWSDEFEDDAEGTAVQDDLYEGTQPAVVEEDLYENVYQRNSTDEQHNMEANGQQGISARALYDYQAADNTEITFDPDDIITGIEMLDEGWWRGHGPDGHYGMFPANYVELL